MYIKITTLLLAVGSAAFLPGCGRSAVSGNGAEAVEASDSIPAAVKQLVRVVADNDSDGFARIVSYPLQRPYPLHDIENEKEMSEYYHKLVDDSLRRAIGSAAPDRWKEFGWRGWTLDDGQYVWVNEKVYDMQYISQTEQKIIDSLTREELSNIAPGIREGWRPTVCLIDSASGKIYRVDKSTVAKSNQNGLYRLVVYSKNDDLLGMPSEMYKGDKEEAGSLGVTAYRFSDEQGKDIMLEPDDPEEASPLLVMPDNSTVRLKRAYWHELVKNGKSRK